MTLDADRLTGWTAANPQAETVLQRAWDAEERELGKPFDWTLKTARRRHEITQRIEAGKQGRN